MSGLHIDMAPSLLCLATLMATPSSVLIAEEHEMMRPLLARALGDGADGSVVSGAASIRAAMLVAATRAPDLVIVDAKLPDGSGPELVRSLRRASPRTRALVVGDGEGLPLVRDALRAGADGVVMKRSGTATLLAALQAIAGGECYFCPASLRLLVEAVRGEDHAPLTAGERAVLGAVARGENAKAIAAQRRLQPKTVRNQLSRLKAKLGIRETAGLVRYAIQHGIAGLP